MSKRSVSTDALETLGQIIDDNQKRDAIHLAVIPMVAVGKLFAGQDIGLVDGGAGPCDNPLGIVDPFLKVVVQPGQRFWMVLYPRMVTSLRHVWTHPAFGDELSREAPDDASKAWMARFAAEAGLSVDDLIEGADARIQHGEYLCDGGRWEGFVTPPEFWTHYEAVTGRVVPDTEKSAAIFTCSC